MGVAANVQIMTGRLDLLAASSSSMALWVENGAKNGGYVFDRRG
jgi:hypothetical protein